MRNNLAKIAILLTLLCTAAFAQEKGSFKDTRDGKTYKTVKIGKQTWMAENLNYAAVGLCYADNPDNCQKYGRLYSWETVKKACPNGWHLPSNSEWNTLYKYVGNKAENKLKAKSGWNNYDSCNHSEEEECEEGMLSNGEDTFGFSALPGGIRGPFIGGFARSGTAGYWWSTSEKPDDYGFFCIGDCSDEDGDTGKNHYYKQNSYSVRCLQN